MEIANHRDAIRQFLLSADISEDVKHVACYCVSQGFELSPVILDALGEDLVSARC